MSKFGIVILHYRTIDKTIDCIESFLKQRQGDCKYVIVANHSGDGTDELLYEKYNGLNNISVIINEKNIVFSKAMNLGVRKLRECGFDYDFIILSNNDIIIDDNDLFNKILLSYNDHHFGVMGPDIFSVSTNSYSNPISKKPRFGIAYNVLSILKSYIDILFRKWNRMSSESVEISNDNHDIYSENVMLHGAFLIFSNEYLKMFPNGLYPLNSFYMEENILYYLCNKYKIKIIYDPRIKITHIHSISVKKMFDDNIKKKNKFVIIQHLKSKKTILKVIIISKFKRIKF